MSKVQKLFRLIPRRYPFIMLFLCLLIYLIYYHRSKQLEVETIIEDFDLFDDDDIWFDCPSEIQFNISNRRHLAIIVAPQFVPFLWKNFRALLCTGVDVYVMLDEVFNINSHFRKDNFPARTNRSIRSYTHRFLYIPNEQLEKYGVSYMSKFPRVESTAWDRAIVWLYHHHNLTTVWLMNYGVQWFHVYNMTHLFDVYASDTTDILCADIIPINSTFWKQWPIIESDIFPKSSWAGTFSPLVRWSRRLLLHHYQYMQLIHKNRLQYEINKDFRFQEFLMGTIANIEKLSIGIFNEKTNFLHISLGDYNQTYILSLLRQGKHIIHPIIHESILTQYRIDEVVKLMRSNNY